jgi:hypothetical protein
MTCLLIDITIADYLDVSTIETKQLTKFKNLEIEVSRMRKVRIKIVQVIIGALGTTKMGLDQNLQSLSGHTSAAELQKNTLMSTAHIIR